MICEINEICSCTDILSFPNPDVPQIVCMDTVGKLCLEAYEVSNPYCFKIASSKVKDTLHN